MENEGRALSVGSARQSGSGLATETDRVEEQLHSPERLIMLSDGVFAIILTLLVLEIKVPSNLSNSSLGEAIHELRPTLVGWIVSFLITGMYWVAHRDIFARVRSVNRALVWLNLLFLLSCALIPFAASVLGEYPDLALAVYLYGIVVIFVSVMRLALYWYVVRHPKLLWSQTPSGRAWQGFVLAAIPIPVYLIAMGVAPASPTVGVVIFLSVPLLYFLAVTVARGRGGTQSEADDFS